MAAYVAADRHLKACGRGAKTLTQIGREIGTTKATVRRWLRRDHWDLWMEHWASIEEIWEAGEAVIVSGREGGLPMSSAAPNSKLPLIFPLLDCWLVAISLIVI